ncbi:MAG: hypothetical protein OXN25_17580 [Candidatus Poribacteria bacterium]|nr:hypothetical protein [Candidatus Poribacteria bacterium]
MNVTTELATDAVEVETQQISLREYAYIQFRKLCTSRGLNFDKMTEDELMNFIDDLIHEDRECGL